MASRRTERWWEELCDAGIDALADLRTGGLLALAQARRDMAGGFPGASGPGPSGDGGSSVEAAAAHGDPVRRAADDMVAKLHRCVRLAQEANRARGWILGPGREVQMAPGSGECVACGRWCRGGRDRIRSGFCGACYQAWLRTDRGEGRTLRETFIATRRRLTAAREGRRRAA